MSGTLVDWASVASTIAGETGPAIPTSGNELAPGERVGEYLIEERIGKGGFGTVYRAVHPVIGKQVAIKVLASRFGDDDAIVSRFVAEARAVNQIRHHNIIDIFAFSQLSDGRHYYVMEYLEGETVERAVATRGAMDLAEALPILRGVARALDAAHDKGIAHRDLKPENILLARDPEGRPFPKLLDFGIAKLLGPDTDVLHKTGTGVPLGTPYCMSPEQCRGRDIDHRTDIYSFGILAYRMLTGKYPFDGSDYLELLFKQVNEDAPPPSSINPALSPQVDDAIAWMMRKVPSERPATALAAVQAIDPTAGITPSIPAGTRIATTRRGGAAAAFAQSDTIAAPRSRGPNRRWVALGAALTVGIATAIVLYTSLASSTSPATVAGPASAAVVTTQDAAPAVTAVLPVDATIAAAVVERGPVIITVAGSPKGMRVSIAGKPIGVAPGPVQVERGTSDIVLNFTADGHETASAVVRPDENRMVTVKLERRVVPGRGSQHTRDTTIRSDELFKKKGTR